MRITHYYNNNTLFPLFSILSDLNSIMFQIQCMSIHNYIISPSSCSKIFYLTPWACSYLVDCEREYPCWGLDSTCLGCHFSSLSITVSVWLGQRDEFQNPQVVAILFLNTASQPTAFIWYYMLLGVRLVLVKIFLLIFFCLFGMICVCFFPW